MLTFTILAPHCADAQDNRSKRNQPILSVSEADADFALQGEYSGELTDDDKRQKFGVQVIALGNGRFRAIAYFGGLPGDGWDGENKLETESELKNGQVEFKSDTGSGLLSKGTLKIYNAERDLLGELKRTIRKSPTLNAEPPPASMVLFAKKDSVANWKNGRVTEDGLLMEGTTSKQELQGGRLHLEFMLSYMPYARDQGRSNSGCYLQGRYEVQVLDSFGLSGEHNECGGIYSVKKPSVNMCFPPLQWQTYDIDFTPAKFDKAGKKIASARMTVRHNGVVIHDDVEVPKSTTAAPRKEGAAPGPVYLQNHGNPIRFRNIWFHPNQS